MMARRVPGDASCARRRNACGAAPRAITSAENAWRSGWERRAHGGRAARWPRAQRVDALQRLHAAVDGDHGDSAVALDDLDIAVEMSAPFVTMSRALLDVWGAEMGSVQPLQVPEEFLQAEVEGEGAMRLENQLWQCRTHRKMHLELATGARGLEVLHCVMYPHVQFTLPIFAMDMVGFGGRVSLCIADLCPIRDGPQLPAALAAALQAEAARTLEPAGIPPRSAPEWGQQIFSERCVLVSPTGADDVDAFVQYAVAALGVYVQAAASAVPCDPEGMRQNAEGQREFCRHQLKNDKTRRLLEASMGAEWTERYMTEILFDSPKVEYGVCSTRVASNVDHTKR